MTDRNERIKELAAKYKGEVINNEIYIARKVVHETAKAYKVEQEIYNAGQVIRINYQFVPKKICLPCDVTGYVKVPEWAVESGYKKLY